MYLYGFDSVMDYDSPNSSPRYCGNYYLIRDSMCYTFVFFLKIILSSRFYYIIYSIAIHVEHYIIQINVEMLYKKIGLFLSVPLLVFPGEK